MRSIGFLALVHALVATVDALLPARAASLTQADRPNGGHRAPAALMQADRPNDWYYDNVEFMNEPFKFIAEHPQDFSPAMQAMAKYQFITAEDSRPLGDLPMYWNEGDQLRQSLLQKSRVADDLARVIMTADLETMGKLAADAKFAEKKELFQRLAGLPKDNRGMLAIHETIKGMNAAGKLPALAAFPGDLEYAAMKVAEANAALRLLDEKYTALFLAVRVTDKLSGAAAQMKEGGRGMPQQPSQGQSGMGAAQPQGRGGVPSGPGGGRSDMPSQAGTRPGFSSPFGAPQQGYGGQQGLGGTGGAPPGGQGQG
eukprot:CAMPEP_0185350224 /NCGR_PEP_ID=MMETSP1364-20130426/2728_1 /TAXON_ID=38817 /ORGANISM="Gephyrocapsa oceanica, Strain RCC1303" /LENGTH=312 /DNA_ID=CAMNT_0027949727 /DNA_START=24 /DNA_END=958 /DNA_ORIENTATION=-